MMVVGSVLTAVCTATLRDELPGRKGQREGKGKREWEGGREGKEGRRDGRQ
jgi:hypothetical protein